MLSKIQREYADVAFDDSDNASRNRLSDEESKANKKVARIMRTMQEDLHSRRELPKDSTPLDRAGTEWITEGIDIYLRDGFVACFQHTYTSITLPPSKTSDKLALNRLMLPYLIKDAINYIETGE